uniref:Uncharacterized protein n=1 Tax=Anguilla anguilla TaxID=7936 RepID=A0A0E9VYI3_ANGAN
MMQFKYKSKQSILCIVCVHKHRFYYYNIYSS